MRKQFQIQNGLLIPSTEESTPVSFFVLPDEAEKKILRESSHIDDHTLHSALDPDEPSRLEVGANYLSLIFKIPRRYHPENKFLFAVASMGLFLFPDRLVILSSEDMAIGENSETLRSNHLVDVFLNMLLSSIRHYHDHLKIMIQITEEIEKLIMNSAENRQLSNLFAIEKSLVFYVYALESNSSALDKLKSVAEKKAFLEPHMNLLDDIVIENTQCSRQAEIYSNILANLMDARVSLVGNNLNVLMKTLNVVTICIMVPTLIVSIFSMNIVLPFEGHPKAFWLVLFLSIISVMGVLVWWHWVSTKLKKQVF